MQNNMMQMLMQLKSNPMAVLGQRFNLPQNMNDPNAILQHLLNTGQVSQQQYQNARMMAERFRQQ